jgi:hypothetical protein
MVEPTHGTYLIRADGTQATVRVAETAASFILTDSFGRDEAVHGRIELLGWGYLLMTSSAP